MLDKMLNSKFISVISFIFVGVIYFLLPRENNADTYQAIKILNCALLLFVGFGLLIAKQSANRLVQYDIYKSKKDALYILPALPGVLFNVIYALDAFFYFKQPIPHMGEYTLGAIVMVQGLLMFALLNLALKQLWDDEVNEGYIWNSQNKKIPHTIILSAIVLGIIFAISSIIFDYIKLLNGSLIALVIFLFIFTIISGNDEPYSEVSTLNCVKINTYIILIAILISFTTGIYEVYALKHSEVFLSFIYILCFHVFGLIGALTYWKLVQQIVEE